MAKERGLATVLVGHVTKDGSVAGPRVLEHLVDVVLHFEGDRHSSLRLIRATKNRFGAVDEIGCFEMREDGIVGLADPSGLFLSERPKAVPGTCVTVTLEGRRPLVTEIQALVARSAGGTPRRSVSGLDGDAGGHAARRSQHDRQASRSPNYDVYASTVGGSAATEPAADLAIALAVAVRSPRGRAAADDVRDRRGVAVRRHPPGHRPRTPPGRGGPARLPTRRSFPSITR